MKIIYLIKCACSIYIFSKIKIKKMNIKIKKKSIKILMTIKLISSFMSSFFISLFVLFFLSYKIQIIITKNM